MMILIYKCFDVLVFYSSDIRVNRYIRIYKYCPSLYRKMAADKEKFKTMHNVFDEFTNRTLFKLITEGHFKGLESPICIGKESNVFTAKTIDDERVIVKIYRLEACDFNEMYNYIKYDPRYGHIKKGKRNTVFVWVQREYRNLMLAREAGVSVPLPIKFVNNILLEEFIGSSTHAAPKLKDQIPKNLQAFYDEVVVNMKKLHKIKLVHADLSAFNILNFKEKPIIIDMSQSTTLKHPQAWEFLQRDVRNVCNFFRKHGLKVEEQETLKKIIAK